MNFYLGLDETTERDNIDTWGDIVAWSDDGKRGLEYNHCIENGDNMSAFYLMESNEDGSIIETDHDRYIHYEIDFDNKNWRDHMRHTLETILDTWELFL